MRPGNAAAGHMKIHTIGHSTRAQGEPIARLTEAGVEVRLAGRVLVVELPRLENQEVNGPRIDLRHGLRPPFISIACPNLGPSDSPGYGTLALI